MRFEKQSSASAKPKQVEYLSMLSRNPVIRRDDKGDVLQPRPKTTPLTTYIIFGSKIAMDSDKSQNITCDFIKEIIYGINNPRFANMTFPQIPLILDFFENTPPSIPMALVFKHKRILFDQSFRSILQRSSIVMSLFLFDQLLLRSIVTRQSITIQTYTVLVMSAKINEDRDSIITKLFHHIVNHSGVLQSEINQTEVDLIHSINSNISLIPIAEEYAIYDLILSNNYGIVD